MKKLNYKYFDIELKCITSSKMRSIPKSHDILKALNETYPDSFCSDLFLKNFSYKPLDITLGFECRNNDEYMIIKKLKKAKYISDYALSLPKERLINGIISGNIFINGEYIGYEFSQTNPIRRVTLPQDDCIFGIEILKDSLFRFLLKTPCDFSLNGLNICGCEFDVQAIKPIIPKANKRYVLQNDLCLNNTYHISKESTSYYKVSYDTQLKNKIICAGSVISCDDYFGNTLDISL